MCTQSRDLVFCRTDVQSRIMYCHIRDDKSGCSSVVMQDDFGFFWQVFDGTMFSPCDNRRRETFNTAGQIQIITIFDCCISSDHRFLHNLKEKISKKISVCLTNCYIALCLLVKNHTFKQPIILQMWLQAEAENHLDSLKCVNIGEIF